MPLRPFVPFTQPIATTWQLIMTLSCQTARCGVLKGIRASEGIADPVSTPFRDGPQIGPAVRQPRRKLGVAGSGPPRPALRHPDHLPSPTVTYLRRKQISNKRVLRKKTIRTEPLSVS